MGQPRVEKKALFASTVREFFCHSVSFLLAKESRSAGGEGRGVAGGRVQCATLAKWIDLQLLIFLVSIVLFMIT